MPTTVWMPGPLRVEVHLRGEDTGGAFCLLVDEPQPGWGLPPHRHEHEAETIHVVAGRFAMTVAGEEREVGPGETVHVPRGVVHAGRLVGDAPGRRVLLFSPSGMERFFLEAGGASAEDAPALDRVAGLAQAHGWRFGD
jgi:quercetin dioxygenase-like cupin family protein